MGGLRSMDGAMGADVSEVLIEPASVPEDQPVALELPAADGSCPVIALRRGAELRVWHNACPHAGRRLDYVPGKFLRQANRLVCAAHGAQIRLEDGACVDGPGRGGALAALEVRPVPEGWRVRVPGR